MSIRHAINNIFSYLSVKDHAKPRTMADSISLIKRLGFLPETVIDIGAAKGTHCLYKKYPASRHILIEALNEYSPYLEALKTNYKKLEYVITAVGSRSGEILINVHTDHLEGSSLLNEQLSAYNGKKKSVPITTVDQIAVDFKAKGPYLVKIDTQGSELEILKGAVKTLKKTEYLILETSFFEFYKGQPLIGDIINYLERNGFVLYDIVDLGLRPYDNACAQVDLAFVKKSGQFRTSNLFATPDQWQPK